MFPSRAHAINRRFAGASHGTDLPVGGNTHRPGRVVKGTIVQVEEWGVLLKLSESIKALCPLSHLSDAPRSKMSAKFVVRPVHPTLGARKVLRLLAATRDGRPLPWDGGPFNEPQHGRFTIFAVVSPKWHLGTMPLLHFPSLTKAHSLGQQQTPNPRLAPSRASTQ